MLYYRKKLKEILDIPVFHDDQHGTAIITCAALINAVDIAKKDIKKIKVVVNGAGHLRWHVQIFSLNMASVRKILR